MARVVGWLVGETPADVIAAEHPRRGAGARVRKAYPEFMTDNRVIHTKLDLFERLESLIADPAFAQRLETFLAAPPYAISARLTRRLRELLVQRRTA